MSELLDAQPAAWRDRVRALLTREFIEAAVLAEFDFADGALRLSNRVLPFTDLNGVTWGAGQGLLVGIADVGYEEGTLAPFREYRMGLPISALTQDDWRGQIVSQVLDKANYVGRGMALRMQLFDPDSRAVAGVPITLDIGVMDNMTASFATDGAVVRLPVESAFARKGVPVYGMQTFQDQNRRYPGDMGMQFTTEANRLVTWTDW